MTDPDSDPADPGMQPATARPPATRHSPPMTSSTLAHPPNHAPVRPPAAPKDSPSSSLSQGSKTTDLSLVTGDPATAQNAIGRNDELTPPTSAISSYLDSQEKESPDGIEKQQRPGATGEKDVVLEPRSESLSQSPPTTATGTKRTASGQIKRASVIGIPDSQPNSLPNSQPNINGTERSRTSSSVSDGSGGNVVELSNQLRTKLKYAMIKVQNGWQSHSLDEVESLASQSPRSTVSGFHLSNDPNHLQSPRTPMLRMYRGESSESDSSDAAIALERRALGNATSSAQSSTPRRSLAPPVDILPGSRRRPTPNTAHYSPQGLQSTSRGLHSMRPAGTQRTPSQNAAMEADAVETLLFMASPNNSGYNPAAHAPQDSPFRSTQGREPTSPLRSQFSQTSVSSPKRVVFSKPGRNEAPFDKAALIDQMLTDLSDESDDELERAFRLAEKGKPAAPIST